jgi:hypothetical protein
LLGLLRDEGWFFQMAPDNKTLRVVHRSKMVMGCHKSNAHRYKFDVVALWKVELAEKYVAQAA